VREEYSFKSLSGKKDKRRADLAIFYEGRPIGFLEIKYEDETKKDKENKYPDFSRLISTPLFMQSQVPDCKK